MVEMMVAAMTGATLGIDAAPFSGTAVGPPKTGQMFIAIDPAATFGGEFGAHGRSCWCDPRSKRGAVAR